MNAMAMDPVNARELHTTKRAIRQRGNFNIGRNHGDGNNTPDCVSRLIGHYDEIMLV